MADIKTRQSNKGTIRTIDRASAMTSHVKAVHARTKEEMLHSREQSREQASSQASDQMGRGAELRLTVQMLQRQDTALSDPKKASCKEERNRRWQGKRWHVKPQRSVQGRSSCDPSASGAKVVLLLLREDSG